jgi:TPR repeat protein
MLKILCSLLFCGNALVFAFDQGKVEKDTLKRPRASEDVLTFDDGDALAGGGSSDLPSREAKRQFGAIAPETLRESASAILKDPSNLLPYDGPDDLLDDESFEILTAAFAQEEKVEVLKKVFPLISGFLTEKDSHQLVKVSKSLHKTSHLLLMQKILSPDHHYSPSGALYIIRQLNRYQNRGALPYQKIYLHSDTSWINLPGLESSIILNGKKNYSLFYLTQLFEEIPANFTLSFNVSTPDPFLESYIQGGCERSEPRLLYAKFWQEVIKRKRISFTLLRDAAQGGITGARYQLARFIICTMEKRPEQYNVANLKYAFELLEDCSAKGMHDADALLAYCFQAGYGQHIGVSVEDSKKKAIYYHKRQYKLMNNFKSGMELAKIYLTNPKTRPHGFKILCDISRQEDLSSTKHLIEIYETGLYDTPVDLIKAGHYLELLALRGEVEALYKMCKSYSSGTGYVSAVDHLKALNFLKMLADKNFPDALLELGKYHRSSQPKRQPDFDAVKALQLFEKAAEQKYTPAYRWAAKTIFDFLYVIFEPSEINLEKIKKYYSLAAGVNDYDAIYEIARCFEFGMEPFARDIEKARELYKKAAQAGHVDSHYRIGKACLSGALGEKADLIVGTRILKNLWFSSKNLKVLAKLGSAYQMSLMHKPEYRRKFADAFPHFSANKAKSEAEFYAVASNKSKPFPLDLFIIDQIQKLIKQIDDFLLKKNHPATLYKIALSHQPSAASKLNDREANAEYKKYLIMAQIALYPKALVDAGFNAEYQIHATEKNPTQTRRLYNLAARMGNKKAFYLLGDLLEHGKNNIPQSNRAALRFYQKAAHVGSLEASFHLGQAYEQGFLGLPINYDKAMAYYKDALLLPHAGASDALLRLQVLKQVFGFDMSGVIFPRASLVPAPKASVVDLTIGSKVASPLLTETQAANLLMVEDFDDFLEDDLSNLVREDDFQVIDKIKEKEKAESMGYPPGFADFLDYDLLTLLT